MLDDPIRAWKKELKQSVFTFAVYYQCFSYEKNTPIYSAYRDFPHSLQCIRM